MNEVDVTISVGSDDFVNSHNSFVETGFSFGYEMNT